MHNSVIKEHSSLTRYAWLSIAAAITTIVIKSAAYLLTGSISLLSDAVESVVNLVGALMALGMLTVAARPPDSSHTFGHSKAEYFASFMEGILILGAAVAISFTAINRLLYPSPMERMSVGLMISTGASIINFVAARVLMKAGRRHNSITLEADSQHLMTDVWTSVGVIGGLVVATATGWTVLDPMMAILVAINILWTGIDLVRRSVDGFMDVALSLDEQKIIERVMAKYRAFNVDFHALRTRRAASLRFLSVHMLVPGDWTVHDAHHLAENFEGDVRASLGEAIVSTHIEPMDDEISIQDIHERQV
jgi:cation diffusion facilitator family transporter